jgi:hypothetical protein
MQFELNSQMKQLQKQIHSKGIDKDKQNQMKKKAVLDMIMKYYIIYLCVLEGKRRI